MILKIVLLVLLFLVLVLLFYPLRFTLHVLYENGKDTEKVILHPVLMIKKIGYTVYDSEEPKQEKQKKTKKKAKVEAKEEKKLKEKAKKEMKPLNELILDILSLMGRFKKGLKWLRVRLSVGYGFRDPAVTGELTGAIYATLPVIFGNLRHSRWRIGLYPVWCTEQVTASVEGDIRVCVFDIMIAFGNMLPGILRILPKKKKKTEEEK